MVVPVLLLAATVSMRMPPRMAAVTATRVQNKAPAPTKAATTLPLKIDGVWYDLAGWADDHPGGRWLLEYARGRDVTALFHSIHLRSATLATSSLATLPQLSPSELTLPSSEGLPPSQLASEGALQGEYVFSLEEPPDEAPIPPMESPLRVELRNLLRREFPTQASTKATPAHWARTWLALIGTCACWTGWLHGSALACLILPFVHWVLIAHTVHEATHGNLSSDPRVNFWWQFTSHPICFNVFVWIPQHLLSHHQYTNDYQHDADCHHFAPAMLSAEQPPLSQSSTFNEGWTFVWKGFLTTLGTSVLQPLRTLLEKPTPNYKVNVTPVPAAVPKRTLLLSILPSLFVMLYPLVAYLPHAPLLGLWLEIWPWVGMSLIFTTMTQVSHVQEQTQPSMDPDRDERCWTARQITTSLDYSMSSSGSSHAESSVVTALAAGLNAQSLHHAMPLISCAHFPRIYGEYAEICERHGVPIRRSRNFGTAVVEMLRYMFKNNAPARQHDDTSHAGH